VTTRARRSSEVDGIHYRFIDQRQFLAMRDAGDLLEWAEVHGNYYGTPRAPVEETLGEGRDVLFDIDWQGTQQLAEKVRDDLVSVFILPPSWRELERRLYSRAQDNPSEINRRMAKASDEMSHWAEYDYVIVNRDLDQCVAAVRGILHSERLKRRRQTGLAEFVNGLKQGQ
jgi:guanylate kinase